MDNKITYSTVITVRLNGKKVGEIRELYNPYSGPTTQGLPGNLVGYRYHPKGDKVGGIIHHTLAGCKQSLQIPAN